MTGVIPKQVLLLILLPLLINTSTGCVERREKNRGLSSKKRVSVQVRHDVGEYNNTSKSHKSMGMFDAKKYARLSMHEKEYIERFNLIARDIASFASNGENLEDFFYVFKNVQKIKDAQFFLLAETHTHSASQLWNVAFINKIVGVNDVVLFEGDQAGILIDNVEDYFLLDIFATREYELKESHKEYDLNAFDKIKSKFKRLYLSTKEFLAFNLLKLDKASGAYWDLLLNDSLHPDAGKRNDSMVQTMNAYKNYRKVFVIAGALHLPHYGFAYTMSFLSKFPVAVDQFLNSSSEASLSEINEAFYQYLSLLPDVGVAQTRGIFAFLRDKNFAVLIPKNLPGIEELRPFFPKNGAR